MLDIVSLEDGADLGIANSAVTRAASVLQVQIGSLEYAPKFGVDLKFFLDNDLQFQNESFRSYLIERLTHHQINASQVVETLDTLFETYTFYVGDAKGDVQGMIR